MFYFFASLKEVINGKVIILRLNISKWFVL